MVVLGCRSLVLVIIIIISKFQDASSGAHELYEMKNRSRELQNPLSLAAEELHSEFHGGSSNGLTQVTRHNNKRV